MLLWSARARRATPTGGLATFARLLWNGPEADAKDQRPLRAQSEVGAGRSADGDPFASFVATHEAALFAYLWRMTGDESAAHDLRQETFIRAWQSFNTVRDYDRPQAWLYRVATNLAFNYRRSQRARVPLSELSLDPAISDHTGRVAEQDLVRATLLALPSRERAALALREGQGLTCDEVAQALNISSAAARTLLWRARERFRDLYDAANPDSTTQGRTGGYR